VGFVDKGFLFFPENRDYVNGKAHRPTYGRGNNAIGCIVVFNIPFVGLSLFLIVSSLMQWDEFSKTGTLSGWETDQPALVLALWTMFTVVWTLTTAYGIVSQIDQRRKDGLLLRDGQVLTGELVKIRAKEGADGELDVFLTVRFQSPVGERMVSGRRRYSVDHLRDRLLPVAGDAVRVVYADDGVWEVL
jgi:hypothetical protein